MRRRARHWALAMHAGTVASATFALALMALSTAGTSTDDVRIAVGELRARAAEAHLVAERAAEGKLTASFVRAQSRQLAQQVSAVEDALARALTRVPSEAAREGARLAPEVRSLVRSLERAAGDPDAVAPLGRALAERTQMLVSLEHRLERASR